MKTKTHKFTVEVKTSSAKSAALRAILSAFARRNPDGCEFIVKNHRKTAVRVPIYIRESYNP